jgi:hypothetical protein
MVLLLIPLLAITYRFTQRLVRSYAIAAKTNNDPVQRPPVYRFWPLELAPLLLVVGTFAPSGYPINQVTIGMWLALFAAVLGGLMLPHFLRQTRSIRGALREAMTFRPLQGKLPGTMRHLATSVIDAFVDAYAILESDGGLLWLLALLLLFWWIT